MSSSLVRTSRFLLDRRILIRNVSSSSSGAATSNNTAKRVGKIIRRKKPQQSPSAATTQQAAAVGPKDAADGPEDVTMIVSNETKIKNGVLATALLTFCGGVMYYSMNAVGQAGSGGDDDPLASLREEAREAQEKHDRDDQSADTVNSMLKSFQAGDYDPDKIEEDEEEIEVEEVGKGQPKRPWWKFW